MAREFFKNLPDTTTPLTAPRLNGLLDGDEAMGNIVVDSVKSKNMFNKNIVFEGYFSSNGSIQSNSNYCYSDYIDVSKSNKITISGVANTGTAHIIEYNANKGYVDFWQSKNQTITLNANTKFIRVSMNINDLDTYQVEKGEMATNYANFEGLGYVNGKNENGNYIKYDDGTLIMFGSTTNNSYSSGIASVSFPYNLISTTIAFMFANENWGSANLANNYFVTPQINSTSNGYIYVRDVNGNSIATNFKIAWLVIGRWK